MKRYLKSAAALLTAVFIGLLAGCASDSADTGGSSGTPSAPSGGAAPSGSAGEGFFNPVGYPIVNEPYELDILMVRFEGHADKYSDNKWFTELREKTNVIPNWIEVMATSFPEQKGVMFASGDLPDVIFGANQLYDNDIIENLDYFMPLNGLIEEYMPNLTKAFEAEPGMRSAATYLDGVIYTLPSLAYVRPIVGSQPIINKVWLDNLGLGIPQTLDELYDVLYAFKNNDPKGDGSLVIPFTGGAADANTFFPELPIATFFGARGNYNEGLAICDGAATFVPATEETKEAIKFMRRMFENGLMDNEFYTQIWSTSYAKRVDSEQPIVGFELGWTPDASFGQWADQYIVIAPPARADGRRFNGQMPGIISRNEYMITTNCEYPEIAARWADEFYTIEASAQNTFGPLDGHCLEERADGTWVVLPPTADETLDQRSWFYSPRDFGPKFFPVNYEDFGFKLELYPDAGDGVKLGLQEIGLPYTDLGSEFPSLAFYTQEQTDVINAYRTDIRTLVNSTLARWVSHGGIEDEWDTYIAQLKSIGLDQWLEAHQAAYDAYMAG